MKSSKPYRCPTPKFDEDDFRDDTPKYVCPLCGSEYKEEGYCDWCRSEARDYLKAFPLRGDQEMIYELLEEEANKLSIEENKRNRAKKTDMVDFASKVLGY